MPPRKPSPVGAHVPGGLGLGYAREVGAEAVQVFVSNPRGWALSAGEPDRDEAFRAACTDARIPVFVHAPYLVNLASPSEATRERSSITLRHSLDRGRRLGARGVVVHAGSAVDTDSRQIGLERLRAGLLPVLDGVGEGPMVLIEPTAGSGQSVASTVAELGPVFAALEDHPRLGVCLDTCHAFAAGHDLATPGGVRQLLNALVKTIGRGRLQLVHANDSRDPLGSRRDRHANIGAGTIGAEPFAELFRHPATSGVPVVVETPGSGAGQSQDIALLKLLRDR
ncbi:MAG TPA: deoxyribonuclease IV [Mycobacteriales bacterium]|nr:deoxyribonuclease IV [Mycobacteriales bacterium]